MASLGPVGTTRRHPGVNARRRAKRAQAAKEREKTRVLISAPASTKEQVIIAPAGTKEQVIAAPAGTKAPPADAEKIITYGVQDFQELATMKLRPGHRIVFSKEVPSAALMFSAFSDLICPHCWQCENVVYKDGVISAVFCDSCLMRVAEHHTNACPSVRTGADVGPCASKRWISPLGVISRQCSDCRAKRYKVGVDASVLEVWQIPRRPRGKRPPP